MRVLVVDENTVNVNMDPLHSMVEAPEVIR